MSAIQGDLSFHINQKREETDQSVYEALNISDKSKRESFLRSSNRAGSNIYSLIGSDRPYQQQVVFQKAKSSSGVHISLPQNDLQKSAPNCMPKKQSVIQEEQVVFPQTISFQPSPIFDSVQNIRFYLGSNIRM